MILAKFINSRNFIKQSAIYFNEEYIWVITESGDMVYMPDFNGEQFRLDLHCSAEDLGACVLSALHKSRKIEFENSHLLTDGIPLKQKSEIWDSEQVRVLGYKSVRIMYQDMMRITVKVKDKYLYFTPSRHVKLQDWEGFSDKSLGHEPVVISLSQSPAKIGAAALQAFERCA